MRFIGSWKAKYFGIQLKKNGMCYYVCIVHPDHRFFGYREDYYDGPIKMFHLWYVGFQSLWDRWD